MTTDLKRLDQAPIVSKVKPKKVSGNRLVVTTLRLYRTCKQLEENHLDATRERHIIPLNNEEGTFFLKRYFTHSM